MVRFVDSMTSLPGDHRRTKVEESLVVWEQHADGFTVVHAANGLGKDGADVNDFELGAQASVLSLWDRVGDENLVNGRGIDASDGVAAKDAVGEQGVHLGSTLTLQELGRTSNGVAGIEQVVDENADAVGDVSNKHHAGVALFRELDGTAFLERCECGSARRGSIILPCG